MNVTGAKNILAREAYIKKRHGSLASQIVTDRALVSIAGPASEFEETVEIAVMHLNILEPLLLNEESA